MLGLSRARAPAGNGAVGRGLGPGLLRRQRPPRQAPWVPTALSARVRQRPAFGVRQGLTLLRLCQTTPLSEAVVTSWERMGAPLESGAEEIRIQCKC